MSCVWYVVKRVKSAILMKGTCFEHAYKDINRFANHILNLSMRYCRDLCRQRQ